MGRYTTVQVYGDTNPNMRKVAYEQASASAASGGEGKAEKGKVFTVLLCQNLL